MIIKSNVRSIKPIIMGNNNFPVIFSNVGVSSKYGNINKEIEKAQIALDAGADAISDLSLCQNIAEVQQRYLNIIDAPFSSVAVYESYCDKFYNNKQINPETIIATVEQQAKRGVDIITLHATVRNDDLSLIEDSKRLIPTTSRGGVMMLSLMKNGNYENPYYIYFDDILKIAKKYNTCLSLGPMYRPGSVWDCKNENSLHFLELNRMSELVEKAKKFGVGITIEGIGHAPINLIESLIKEAKKICNNSPYRVLTVATDIAMGFDHVSSAISSALSVYYGADSITCVTRKEHIGLPSSEDIKEAVFSAKVAAECGFSARTDNFTNDYFVSNERKYNGCCARSEHFLFHSLIDYCKKGSNKSKSCGMCEEFCPFLIIEKLAKGE